MEVMPIQQKALRKDWGRKFKKKEDKMKRVLLALVAIVVIGVMAFSGCAPEAAPGEEAPPEAAPTAEYEWRIADFYTEGCDAALGVEYFGHLLNGMSGGRIHAKY